MAPMHPQQSPPQLPDSGSARLSSKHLQIVQYSGSLLFVMIPLPKRPVFADFCRLVSASDLIKLNLFSGRELVKT